MKKVEIKAGSINQSIVAETVYINQSFPQHPIETDLMPPEENDFKKVTAQATEEDLLSLQRELAELRENLRLIQERKAEFVLGIDIPLQLVKEEGLLLDKIAKLELQLAVPH